jgi:hypothetical protein
VVAIWMHLPPKLRAEVHRKAVAALKPGGTLILEACTPRQLELATGGPPENDLLIEPAVLRLELEGLEIQFLEEKSRWIEEGQHHRGESAVVQAVGRKPATNRAGPNKDLLNAHNAAMLIAIGD